MADQTLFSKHLNNTKFQKKFRKHWHSQSDFKSANLEIISKPFKVCRISNFLRDETIIENLKSELECYDHRREVLDLFQFKRTKDLRRATDKYIQMLNKSFRTDLVSWMKRNTNIELNGKVSMSSARYNDTDHLLCHDDNMDDRRIAYIFYLTKGWSKKYGGTLDLFDTDEKGPTEIVKSLIPEYNSLVFFEVVKNSYHQVAEVLTSDRCRWSLSGWFHGPLKEDFRRLRYGPEALMQLSSTEVDLHSWILDDYLAPNIICQIQKEIELTSYGYLNKYLKESAYQQIMNDLTSQDISWRMIGPPDMRHYEIADEQTLPELLKDFCNLFKSISFFKLLETYTGLELIPEETTRKPRMTLELQRWSSGCYTLLYDRSLLKKNTLDKSIGQFDNNVSVDDATASTSGLSTSETNPNANETRRKLKRERIEDSPSPANPPDKKKVARHFDCQSDVGTQFSSQHEHDMDEVSSSDEKLSRSGTPTSDSESLEGDFVLDVMILFHTKDAKGIPKLEDTIDYVDPEKEGVLIQVPIADNCICLVYRSILVPCLQKYLNHYYDGYSYTFMCTYHMSCS